MKYLPRLFPERRVMGELVLDGWEPPPSWPIDDDLPDFAWLYGFACDGFYKIGQARDWLRRLRSMQNSCPLELRKVHVVQVPFGGANYGEGYALHEMGEPARGEWFTDDGRDDRMVRRILERGRTRAFAYDRHFKQYQARKQVEWATERQDAEKA